MPVRVCDRCKRFLVGVRPGPHDTVCPYCEAPLRKADSDETLRFIEELREAAEEWEPPSSAGGEASRS